MIGYSKLVEGYSHIYMLNGYRFPKNKTTLYKYMPLNRLLDAISKKELVFVSPEVWYDPFEQLYHGIDLSARGYKTEEIACMCLSEKSSTNEDASWRVYADSNNKCVRLSVEQDALLKLLDDYASKNGFTVYIGKVNYSFEKRTIKNLWNCSIMESREYFPEKMKREHYLSIMLLKRKAFQYENEVRVFLVKDKIAFNNNLLKLSCNYKQLKLVSNVMLSPYPPVRVQNDLAYSIREKLNDMESEAIKHELKSLLSCRIQQSKLYKVYPKVKTLQLLEMSYI